MGLCRCNPKSGIMNNKILIAIAVAVVVTAAACAAVVLTRDGGNDDSDTSVLTVKEPGTYSGGSYDTVIISSEVGDGNVLLKNTKISKELIVKGGGSHSVVLEDCQVDGTTTVEKTDGESPRIVANNTQLTDVNAKTDVILESSGTGSFENVSAEGTSAITVQGADTTVKNVALASGSKIEVTNGTVNNLSVGDDCSVKVTSGTVDSVNVSAGTTVSMEIGADGSVGLMTVGDNVSVNTTGEGTAEKLENTDIKMDSEASGSDVNINGKTTHVHQYYFRDVDWNNFDKEAMTVIYALECNLCTSMESNHMTYHATEVLSRTEQPTCTTDGSVTTTLCTAHPS